MLRVAVFTANISHSVAKGLAELVRTFHENEWLVLEYTPRRRVGQYIRSQWRNLKKHGVRRIAAVGREVGARLLVRLRRPAPARCRSTPGDQYLWRRLRELPRISHVRVPDLNAPATLERVRSFHPDVGLSLAAPILKRELFSIPRLGTINLHKGRLPSFRGMPPAFWELVLGEREVGCSVHKVEDGLDTGDVLVAGAIRVEPHSTVRGLQLKLDELGVRMTVDAMRALATGAPVWTPQGQGGHTFRKPTLKEEADLNRRHPAWPAARSVRDYAKDTFFRGYTNLFRPIPRYTLSIANRQRVIVLLYHRVNDTQRDNLTVGIEQFDAQMAWLARRYPLASVDEIVCGDFDRRVSRPIVVVTFDDGYLDNYENAAPILLRHRIPAAFFVSTGVIGGNQGFAHDRHLGPLPTMNWDHLRAMRAAGFVIGSHTVNHIDCGRADLSLVARELEESRDALAGELDVRESIFAYPFGGRENMRPAALELVKQAGYVGCLSAYGGANEGALDRFNILRTGISCKFSMAAFQARVEGFA